jgi:hypothetical protein
VNISKYASLNMKRRGVTNGINSVKEDWIVESRW